MATFFIRLGYLLACALFLLLEYATVLTVAVAVLGKA